MRLLRTASAIALITGLPLTVWAQDTDTTTADAPPAEATETQDAPEQTDTLLTDAELQTLVAPVALYPDTLLIQVLVAATEPLEVIKADQFLDDNADTAPEDLKPQIESKDWDPSVAVLATAFPDVLGEMAEHLDWTETTGNAMLAQSDDVMTAVQVLRDQAVNTGALVSGEQQVVETDATDNVVIVPADPEVVYVPQYEPNNIWGDVGSAVVTGAIAWGAFTIIDEIFDDDDDWDDYWGCHNCGGWGGGPIIRDPDIDIDIDGNVNIGNQIDIDRDKLDIDRDKIDIGDNTVGWKPDPDRGDSARDKIAAKRDENGATTLPLERAPSKADDLRDKLSRDTGAADISGAAAGIAAGAAGAGTLAAINRPSKVSDQSKRDALSNTKAKLGNTSGGTAKPAIKKPATTAKPALQKPAVKKPTAISKKSPGNKAKAATNRGKASGAKHKLKKR